jgi:hypothetical protein
MKYTLTDQQIEFIREDISKRGIEMESLRESLIDHVCSIIENEFDGLTEFKEYYQTVIKKFYKTSLREIEDETILHLKFKNYYTMKKAMIYSGAFTVGALMTGTFFKFMYWPGANMLLVLSLLIGCLVFLPLMYLIKSKEGESSREKLIMAIGIFAFILFSLSIMFRIQHWPGSMILCWLSLGITFLLFIPLYFFNGIKNPEKKMNTTVFTVILVLFAGLQLMLINIHPAKRQAELKTNSFFLNEKMLSQLKGATTLNPAAEEIYKSCEEIKSIIFQNSTGWKMLQPNSENPNVVLEESNLGNTFLVNGSGAKLFVDLKSKVGKYNEASENDIETVHTILDIPVEDLFAYSGLVTMNNLSQIQMSLLLNK